MTHVAEQQKAEESKSQKQGFPTEAEGLEQIHHLTLDASKHIEAIETRAPLKRGNQKSLKSLF